jgi:arylsulfate sulfotransferase
MKHVSVYLGTFAVLSALAGCGGTSTTATTTQTSSPSFSLQVLPSSVTLTAGGTSQVITVSAFPVDNFSGSVAIKLGSLPAGVTATPSSLSVAVGSMGQFTLSAAASSQAAHVDLPVSASAGEIQQSAKASLTIDQAVTPPTITTVSLSTLAFDFGDNLVGNALTKTAVTVTNTGSAALTLNPTVGGDTSFVLATGSSATSSSCGQHLAPAASCNVVLVYTPAKASTPGVQTAKLNLGLGGVAAGTQQNVAISGTAHAIPVGNVTSTNNPQVALYTLALPFAGSVSVNFGTDTKYGLNTWAQSSGVAGGPVSLFVAGMRASTTYHMQAAVTFANGITVTDTDHTFTTGALPADMALNATATTTPGLTPQPGVELLSPMGKPAGIMVTDLSGNPLWAYKDPGTPGLDYIYGAKFLPNGNFLMPLGASSTTTIYGSGTLSSDAIDEIREVNLAGDTVREISVADVNDRLASATCAECHVKLDVFHHDVEPLPNGHWIVLANTRMTLSYSTQPVLNTSTPTTILGDVIIDLDENLQPVWVWNQFNHLDPNRHPYLFPDWTHTNAVLYSKDDGNLIVSMRHQNWVIKVKYADGTGDGSILWRLGESGDLTLKGGTDPTDWTYAQHDPTFFSAATAGVLSLGIMDNGDDRQFPAGVSCNTPGAPNCLYTSIPVYQIDEGAKTATLTFHQILPSNLYSFFGGSTEQLANGNVHYALCGLGVNSAIYEVTQQSNPQTVWSMQVTGTNMYRARRLPSLYPGVQW